MKNELNKTSDRNDGAPQNRHLKLAEVDVAPSANGVKATTRKPVDMTGNVGGVAKEEVGSDSTRVMWIPVGVKPFPGVKCEDETEWNGHIKYIDHKKTRQECKPPDPVRDYGGIRVELGGRDQLLAQPGGWGDGCKDVTRVDFGEISHQNVGQMNMMKDVDLGADLGNQSRFS